LPRATFHRKIYNMPLLGSAKFIGVKKRGTSTLTEVWLKKYTSVAESAEKPTRTGYDLGRAQSQQLALSRNISTGNCDVY
jgi:hypothetical protein